MSSESADSVSGKTMIVARASGKGARRGSEIVKAAELILIRTVDGGRQLGLAARRVVNLLIQAAAGEAHKDKLHSIPRKVLRQGHESNDRLPDILREVSGAVIEIRGTDASGIPGTWRTNLLEASFEPDDTSDAANVYFTFSPKVRELLKKSETFASLEAQAILAFTSRYSMVLYEIGCQLVNRREPSATYEIADLRKILHVPPGALKEYTDLKRKAFDIAKLEIDQLATFTFTWTEHREGRRVAAVTLTFWRKPASQLDETFRELDRHSTGRKARREGVVERVEPAPAALPSPPPAKRPARGLATLQPLPGVDHERLRAWVKSSKSVAAAMAKIEEARAVEAAEPGAAARMMSAAFAET
jgi:hypothetical protein